MTDKKYLTPVQIYHTQYVYFRENANSKQKKLCNN